MGPDENFDVPEGAVEITEANVEQVLGVGVGKDSLRFNLDFYTVGPDNIAGFWRLDPEAKFNLGFATTAFG